MKPFFQPSQFFESSQPQLKVVPIKFNLILSPNWCSHKSISLILMLPKEVNFSKMMMMIISSSINDNFNSQLCSQSPYVLHSILVISSPEMHGTFILNVAHFTILHQPKVDHQVVGIGSMGCKQVAKHQWWNNPSLKYFSADPRGFTSFRWHCNLPFQLNLMLTAQASPNLQPHLSMLFLDFAFLVVVMVEVIL